MDDPYIIKVLAPDATEDIDSTDPTQYSINSDYYNLKIMDNLSTWPTSATIGSGTYNVDYTITHNLGYVPLYDLYFKDQSGRLVAIPGHSTDTYGTNGRITNETNSAITVRLGRGSGTYPTDVTYEVFHMIYIDPKEV